MNENNNVNCEKHAHHSDELKRNLDIRFKKIEGQIKGVNNMIQNNVYCDNILNQISSIQSALSSARNVLLEAHINSCIKESIEGGEDSVIKELMKTLNRMLK
jgi:CsoR family transcriptional regulator, copper-sensing transcriptional repressor